MDYSHLNQHIAPNDALYSDAWRRTLNRLGEYTATILRSLKIFPTNIELLDRTATCILIRVHMPQEYVVLRIAPEHDLFSAIYFARMMARHQLPAVRLLHYDTSRALVPFAYMIEGYIGGLSGTSLDTPHMLQGLARQVGRTLRRIHRVEADGWGYPSSSGRWQHPDWQSVLQELHQAQAPSGVESLLFGETERATMLQTIAYLGNTCQHPYLMHGNMHPRHVRCTIAGEQVRLEALIDPGGIVGGDGLLELARGLDTDYPKEWCNGLFEGYGSLIPLGVHDLSRLRLLQLLSSYWKTCQQYLHAEMYKPTLDQTLLLLAEVAAEMHPEETK